MTSSRLKIAFLAASLASCYAQVDDSSVQLTHSLCNPSTTPCIPGAGVVPVPISTFNASGNNTFTVSFGAVPLLQSTSSVGPATAHTTLALNSSSFEMKTAGASFSGIKTVQLLKAPTASTAGSDPCAAPTANCPVIASYDSATDGPSDQQIVLKSKVANLLDLIDPVNHNIIFEVRATGYAPPNSWSADLVMNLGMTARVNYP